MMAKIFIASPYSAPTLAEREANVVRANDAMIELLKLGFAPFPPTLAHYLDPYSERVSWEGWLTWSMTWVEVCDALLLLGESPGSIRERDRALGYRIPVFTSIAELVAWKEEVASRSERLGWGEAVEMVRRQMLDQEDWRLQFADEEAARSSFFAE